MKNKIIAAATVFSTGILLVLGIGLSTRYAVLAKGEEDFRIEDSTLTAYVGNDTFVSIPDGITEIGEGAFADNKTLKSVEIPIGIEEIAYNAFGGCTALENVSIPDSVVKVGPGAFKGCTSLKLVEIGKSVSSWGSGVFNDCTQLSKLILDDENRYLTYYNGAIYNGNMSFLYQVLGGKEGENYVMPEEVEEIDTYAFWNLKNVKNIKLSDSITTIPAYSMTNMGSVENVVIPKSVTSVSDKAFANDVNLKQVTLWNAVNKISDTAFSNCTSLKVLTEKDSYAEKFAKEHKIPVIYEAELPVDFNDSNPNYEVKPDLKKKIVVKTVVEKLPEEDKSEETEEETSKEEYTDESQGNVIGKTIIVNGEAVLLMNNHTQKVYGEPKVDEETNETIETDETGNESEEASDKTKENTKEDSIPENGKSIEERKFYKRTDLTNYTISEDTKEIKRLAFARSGLAAIDIPDSVETIGYGAFYSCENLEEVKIPDSVTSIETKAFADTPWLGNWLNGGNDAGDGSDFLIVGDGILLAYRGNKAKVTIPESVKQIGSEAFKGHEELEEITVPETVERINAEAFRNCSSLMTVNGCKGVKTVIRGAFYGTKVDEESLSKRQ